MLARVDRYAAPLHTWCSFLVEYAELYVDTSTEPWQVHVTIEQPTVGDLRTCREAIELLVTLGSVDVHGLCTLLQPFSGWRHSRTSSAVDPAAPPPRWRLSFPIYDAQHQTHDTDAFRQFCIRDHNEPRSAAFCRAMAQLYAAMTPAMRAALSETCEIVCPIKMAFQPTARDVPQIQHREYIAAARTLLNELAAEAATRHGVVGSCSHAKLCNADALVDCMRFDVVSVGFDLDFAKFALDAGSAADIRQLEALGVDIFEGFRFRPDSLIENTPLVHLGRIFHDYVDAKDSHGLAIPASATAVPQQRYGSGRQTQLSIHTDDEDDATVAIRRPSPRHFFALCSALVSTQRIQSVYIRNLFADDAPAMRRTKWQWLSYAVLSKAAASQVETLVLQDVELRSSDIEAIMSVLERAHPVPKLMDRASLVEFFGRDRRLQERQERIRQEYYDLRYRDYGLADYDDSEFDESNDDESDFGESNDDESGGDSDADLIADRPFRAEGSDRPAATAATVAQALPAPSADQGNTSGETQATDADRAALTSSASAVGATASAPSVDLATMFARTSAAAQFHTQPAAADGAANANGDEAPIADEDAGSVLLKAGVVVVVNPFDTKDWVDRAHQSITMEHDVQFPILRNDTRCEWIDIVVPGFGYCAVPRAFVDQVVVEPVDGTAKSSIAIGYTGAITSLSLEFGTCDERPDLLLPLFEYLGPRLTSLTLGLRLRGDPQSFRRILDACPRLRELEMTHALPPQVLSILADVYTAGTCCIEKLKVTTFSPGHDLLVLVDALQKPSSAIAQTLRHLSIKCNSDVPLDERTLTALGLMLQVNNVLETVEIHAPTVVPRNIWLDLIATDGKCLPVVAAPLPLASRLAFLSVLQHYERQQQQHQSTTADAQDIVQSPPLKRMRVSLDTEKAMTLSTTGADFARLDTSVIRLIFAFAAEPATRKIRVWKRKYALD